ncbi:GldG family protein [Pseudomonas allokribbensis]|uniref:GldG family protein n=1 Tax=Pseudomonas allokribbensis TaxID=2774460 RepID=UPI001787E3D7|nr:Gldg family protein [Pseudomonas allokribbensis]
MKRVMYSGVGLLLIALLFLAFNVGVGKWLTDVRLDLTEHKLYSISPGTRQILANLEKPIDLHFFYSDSGSKELVPLRGYALRVEELLKVYEREAGGKLRLHIIDPQPFSDEEDRANGFGLQAVPLRQGVAPVYFGLVGTDSQNNAQVIPFFPPEQEERLEYEISRLIQTLLQPQRPVVGLLSTLPINGGFNTSMQRKIEPWVLAQEIRREFELRELSAETKEIPPEVTVLMLVHPKKLTQSTLYAIDQFVLRGGKLLAFVDPLSEQDPGEEHFGIPSKDKSSDLAPLFNAWGVQMQPGKLLADGSYALFDSSGEGGRPIPRPFTLELPQAALSQEDPSTSGLESISLTTAGIIEPVDGATTRFTPLMHSSNYAMPLEVNRFEKTVDLDRLMQELAPHSQRYVTAARIQGPATSAFADGIEGHRNGLKQAQQINVIAVADTDLLSDRMWLQTQDSNGSAVRHPWTDNANFVLNALDSLSGSDALNSLRSRGRYNRPFVVVELMQRKAEASFRKKQSALQMRLDETERTLAQLQEQRADKTQALDAEQQSTVRQFMQEKMRIRQQLREVQYQLNVDIDALGRLLKVVNIALVPLLLTVCMLVVWSIRHIRRVTSLRR